MSVDEPSGLTGERSAAWTGSSPAPHTRVSNRIALVSASAFGVAILGSYYWHTAHGQAPSRAQSTEAGRPPEPELPAPDFSGAKDADAAVEHEPVQARGIEEAALVATADPPNPPVAGTPPGPDRRLAGSVYAPAGPSNRAMTQESAALPGAIAAKTEATPPGDPVAVAVARFLPDQRLMLPKGAFIDCTLETAIDSTLPGYTTCVTATDTFGVDGTVVLLERGSKISGETRGQIQQGQARVAVLWTEARTPAGVIVPLESPAADPLGRAGLEGTVDRHFWQRFGAALLISTIDSGTQAAVQSMTRSGSAVVYGPAGSEQVATEALKGTLDIPPTVRKNNGERVQVLVARDVDFRAVYELRHVRHGQ